MVYVALLRGINVGGKNKVGMKELKAAWDAWNKEQMDPRWIPAKKKKDKK